MAKILRVISSTDPENGGPINGLVNSSKGLINKGHLVDVLTFKSKSKKTSMPLPFTMYSFDCYMGTYSYSKDFKQWMHANVINYDIVIIHGLWQYHSYCAASACVLYGIPYLVFTHGMLDPWFNKVNRLKYIKKYVYWSLFEKSVLNNAAFVLFTSDEEMRLARTSFPDYRPKERVVSYGSKLPSYDLVQCVDIFFNQFPSLERSDFALFISRVHPKKGVDLLIKAITEIKDSLNDNFKLVIAGPVSDEYKRYLVSLVESNGVSEFIVWTGMLSDQVKWGAFGACQFFILPSHQENFGIVVAEALSCSKPVLISDKVNIWREIASCNAGFIDNDSVQGVKNLLAKWFSLTGVQAKNMGRNAYNCYANNFSIEKAVDDLDNVINIVLGGKNE